MNLGETLKCQVFLPSSPCIIMFCVGVLFQLEMERALLEGEQRDELEQLRMDQEHITMLKQRQIALIDAAMATSEKVRI